MVGRIPLEGLEIGELESKLSRGGDERGVDIVDEVLRGIRGKGALALLALRLKRWSRG